MRRGLLSVAAVLLLLGGPAGARPLGDCTAAEQAAAQQKLHAFRAGMAKAKARYFKTHKKAAEHAKFVNAQRAKLHWLQHAAACTVPPPPPANVAPTAVIAAATSAVAGDAVAFDGSKSSDADGTIAGYAWSFDDGTNATGAAASHTFAAAGTYTITLTVTDDKGATGTASTSLTVARPTTTVFDFHYGPGVSDADKAAIEAGAAASGRMLDTLGHALMRTPVYVETDARALAADFVALNGGTVDSTVTWLQTTSASASFHGIFLLPSHPDWANVPPGERPITTAHESFHVFQNEQFPGPRGASGGADGSKWLHEGAAEWWGCYAAGARGVDQRRDNYARIVRDNPSLTLAGLESQSAGNEAYGFGYIAVDRLVTLKGVQSLFEFWRIAGAGTPWQTAFQQAFGMSLESFYADFEAYRRTL